MLGNILAVGLMSMGMGLSGVKDEPQMRANAQETITLPSTYTAQQLIYLAKQYIPEMNEDVDPAETYTEEVTVTGTYSYIQSGGGTGTLTKIKFSYYNPHSWSSRALVISSGNSLPDQITINVKNPAIYDSDGTYTITSYPEEWTYYLNEEQPPQPMGQSIIGSIASGLGIIGALASEFLVGFGALFYAEGALTPFAIFALVMLGIAVSFAVVKLALSLIRSNTGA